MTLSSQPPYLPLPAGEIGLLTDLYELTMAQSYFAEGISGEATFSLYVREYPPDRGYLVAAGIDDALDCLEALSFDTDSIDYLRSTGIFTADFLEYLRDFRFTGSVRAMPEGSLFFTHEPVLEVTGPIIAAQLAETIVMNQVQYQTLLATKSARCVQAARGRPIADFAARRTHGTEASLKMARASYIAGFGATSNVLAARRYGIPPTGTMAHSYITSFDNEIDAFRAYSRMFPDRSILLLDTYDTISGAHAAVAVAHEMERDGHHLTGVRLDSGDFDALSRQVRSILDDAGLDYVRIVASGGLDEYEIDRLVSAGAPIDMFGVGTRVGVSADAPSCDMVYKMVSYDGRPVMKLSEGKASLPAAKQVFRQYDPERMMSADVIGLSTEATAPGEPQLSLAMQDGRRVVPPSAISDARQRVSDDLSRLPDTYRRLRRPDHFPVSISEDLQRLESQIRGRLSAALSS
ncbi:MAG: nicotinate phosphoribosyltransferase [Chloroflexota bacterium]|nr:nicotinate phosphoribosyltransferase [Chloroflexota bacterium]MDE2958956.1 nicotinate phosphoribosyltransferase [Chloroflexota bacterium]